MDGSSRRRPSSARFRIVVVIVVLLIAVLVWFGIEVKAETLGPVWDRLFKPR